MHSEGIHALAAALTPLGEVIVVAPHIEASAIGHALTLRRPLRMEKLRDGVYEVDGTPTDCVNIALTQLYTAPPNLVVSGINKGYNLGDDVTYSGTVAGALEAALLGIPAMAISLGQGGVPGADFGPAAQAAADVAHAMLSRPLPARTFANVNVPPGTPRGYRTTIQGRRNHETTITARVDPRGRSYYWIDEMQSEWQDHDRSDYVAVRDGWVSVTPLHPDLTAHAQLDLIDALLPARSTARS